MKSLNKGIKSTSHVKKLTVVEEVFNYLEHPVILAYLDTREQEIHYGYIKHKVVKRTFEDEFVKTCTNFLDITASPENRELLDEKFFRNKYTAIKDVAKFGKGLKSCDKEGYNLLELTEPVTFERLRYCYKKAALKYHPDLGGSHDKMIEVNNAFELFHKIISTEGFTAKASSFYSIGETHEVIDWPCKELDSIDEYIFNIHSKMFNIRSENWDIKQAREHLNNMIEIGSEKGILDIDLCKTWLALALIGFAMHLTYIGKSEDANYYKNMASEYNTPPFGLFDLLKDQTITRINTTHLKQTENLWKYGVITAKRYQKAIQRFKKRDEEELRKQNELRDFINKYGFYQVLPYDEAEVDFRNRFIQTKYISYTQYWTSDLSLLEDDQKTEYFLSFSENTSIELVRKYMVVRAGSLLHSIILYYDYEENLFTQTEDTPKTALSSKNVSDFENLLNAAIRECKLIKSIQVMHSKIGGRFFDGLIQCLDFLQNMSNEDRIERLDILRTLHQKVDEGVYVYKKEFFDSIKLHMPYSFILGSPFRIGLNSDYYAVMMLPLEVLKRQL